MTDEPCLLVSDADLRFALAFALSHRAGKRAHRHDQLAYDIAAEALVEHLRLSSYVVMRRPPSAVCIAPDLHPKQGQ